MNKKLLIHNNNIVNIDKYDVNIKFSTIKNILHEIKVKEFNCIYIKDSLTSNYMEFTGLILAYHIRLTEDLEDKKFVPIVIISDLDGFTLNKITPFANILLTKSIFLNVLPTKYSIINKENFKREFLEKITIERPKDTSGEHDIANQWSIYKWSDFLGVKKTAIERNNEKIEDMLYFKFLKAKFQNRKNHERFEVLKPNKKGKILFIDDEWNKGWGDIMSSLFNKYVNFETFEYDFKDKSKFHLYLKIQSKVKEYNPDVIILDLRLAQEDHENDDIDSFTGIKILEKIHEINAGIQVIMLTATSKSTILEKLYEKKILGYIKKEHPDDISINTLENINKLVNLADKGLDKKYLKEINNIKNEIIDLLKIDLDNPNNKLDLFEKFAIDKSNYLSHAIKIYRESVSIFDILDSNNKNKLIYSMLSIISAVESILKIFLNENKETFWDGQSYNCEHNALRCRILELFKSKFNSDLDFDLKKIIDKRNDYLHSLNNVNIEPKDIVFFFNKLKDMIKVINTVNYNRNNVALNIKNLFNK